MRIAWETTRGGFLVNVKRDIAEMVIHVIQKDQTQFLELIHKNLHQIRNKITQIEDKFKAHKKWSPIVIWAHVLAHQDMLMTE